MGCGASQIRSQHLVIQRICVHCRVSRNAGSSCLEELFHSLRWEAAEMIHGMWRRVTLLWEGILCGKALEQHRNSPCFSSSLQVLPRKCNDDQISVVLWKGVEEVFKAGPLYTQAKVS